MKARCLVVAMVLTATAVAGAKEPLSIRVSPAFSFAPRRTSSSERASSRTRRTARWKLSRTRPNSTAQARLRSKAIARPRATIVENFAALPPGDYEVTAVLIREGGQRRAIAHAHLNVLELGAAR